MQFPVEADQKVSGGRIKRTYPISSLPIANLASFASCLVYSSLINTLKMHMSERAILGTMVCIEERAMYHSSQSFHSSSMV